MRTSQRALAGAALPSSRTVVSSRLRAARAKTSLDGSSPTSFGAPRLTAISSSSRVSVTIRRCSSAATGQQMIGIDGAWQESSRLPSSPYGRPRCCRTRMTIPDLPIQLLAARSTPAIALGRRRSESTSASVLCRELIALGCFARSGRMALPFPGHGEASWRRVLGLDVRSALGSHFTDVVSEAAGGTPLFVFFFDISPASCVRNLV